MKSNHSPFNQLASTICKSKQCKTMSGEAEDESIQIESSFLSVYLWLGRGNCFMFWMMVGNSLSDFVFRSPLEVAHFQLGTLNRGGGRGLEHLPWRSWRVHYWCIFGQTHSLAHSLALLFYFKAWLLGRICPCNSVRFSSFYFNRISSYSAPPAPPAPPALSSTGTLFGIFTASHSIKQPQYCIFGCHLFANSWEPSSELGLRGRKRRKKQ